MQSLNTLPFQKEFVEHFPGDHSGDLTPRPTPGVLYSRAVPTPVKQPELIGWSEDLAKQLGIQKPVTPEEVAVLTGNNVTPTMYPYAACYAGHQFGNWAGQLGDGRAITLGEIKSPQGEIWELQLKGAGPTPYSRRADGRAVLRSSVREYLMSEAMHYLGVPTTRALSLAATGDQVLRDMFYNGYAAFEPGAIVMRVAPSFLRFGNFEILAARKEIANLQKLVDWTIERYYPHIEGENKIVNWFKEIVERTATLMVEWMRVGFVHGVMNTDNMSILGLTIDYGPYSFVDNYDPAFTPNTTDLPGRRYAFGRQPSIGKWNLSCLGGAIAPLLEDTTELVNALELYDGFIAEKYYAMIGHKLGLDTIRPEDEELIGRFEKALATIQPDMTLFYQLLIDLPEQIASEKEVLQHFNNSFYNIPEKEDAQKLFQLIKDYQQRLLTNTNNRENRIATMRSTSPRFILRNYLLHQAIEGLEKGDPRFFLKLQEAIKEPYSNKYDELVAKRPDWASQKAGCSMLSCSS